MEQEKLELAENKRRKEVESRRLAKERASDAQKRLQMEMNETREEKEMLLRRKKEILNTEVEMYSCCFD